jgi:hypothetical protein
MRPWCSEHRELGRNQPEYDEDVERMRARKRRREQESSADTIAEARPRNKVTNRRHKKWVRTWKKGMTRVAPSKLPNAGLGLWTNRNFLPGDRVARVSGDVLDEFERAFLASDGVLQISEGLYLDTSGADEWEGKFVNDGPHSGEPTNVKVENEVRHCEITNKKWAYLVAIAEIKEGDEILLDYGEQDVWNEEGGDGRERRSVRL